MAFTRLLLAAACLSTAAAFKLPEADSSVDDHDAFWVDEGTGQSRTEASRNLWNPFSGGSSGSTKCVSATPSRGASFVASVPRADHDPR